MRVDVQMEVISDVLGLFLIIVSPNRVVFSLTFPVLIWTYGSGRVRESLTHN